MCDVAFTPVRLLPALDGILLWSMRAWAVGIREKMPVEEKINDAFSRIGAPDVAGQLFGFMWLLSHGANRMLNVDCACNPFVSADERSLLDVTALSQYERSFEALLILRTMARPAAALGVHDAAIRVATALSAAGQFLQQPKLETQRYIIAPGQACMDDPVSPTRH